MWHHAAKTSHPSLVTPCHKNQNTLPPLMCDVIFEMSQLVMQDSFWFEFLMTLNAPVWGMWTAHRSVAETLGGPTFVFTPNNAKYVSEASEGPLGILKVYKTIQFFSSETCPAVSRLAWNQRRQRGSKYSEGCYTSSWHGQAMNSTSVANAINTTYTIKNMTPSLRSRVQLFKCIAKTVKTILPISNIADTMILWL